MDIPPIPGISFEFFPPKTPEAKTALLQNAITLSKASPEFFSVTFGAGGSTREGTLETVKMLQQASSIPLAPHISCMGSAREKIVALLENYLQMGIRRLVALRGDLPSGMGAGGEFRYACELVKLIRDTCQDYFHIEVAAYPEFHPQCKSAQDDLIRFQQKVEAGANSALTQYFYNPDAYFRFVDDCARLGIFIPIVPGIMPITNVSRLARFSDLCGAEIPRWIRRRLESYGDDELAIKTFGAEVVYDLCHRLLAGGAPGLHFYTMNQADSSMGLLKMLQTTMTDSRQGRFVNV